MPLKVKVRASAYGREVWLPWKSPAAYVSLCLRPCAIGFICSGSSGFDLAIRGQPAHCKACSDGSVLDLMSRSSLDSICAVQIPGCEDRLFVMKRGGFRGVPNPAHMSSEFFAQALYSAMGAMVPSAALSAIKVISSAFKTRYQILVRLNDDQPSICRA